MFGAACCDDGGWGLIRTSSSMDCWASRHARQGGRPRGGSLSAGVPARDTFEHRQHLEGGVHLERRRPLVSASVVVSPVPRGQVHGPRPGTALEDGGDEEILAEHELVGDRLQARLLVRHRAQDRKSTRLNSIHVASSYAVSFV